MCITLNVVVMGIRITIRNRNGAVLVSFHTVRERFDSEYERNKFFRELHGWEQIVPQASKRYVYRRRGILDEVPHIKVADSVFIVAAKHMQRMQNFFDQWEDKVHAEMMEVFVEREKLRKLL